MQDILIRIDNELSNLPLAERVERINALREAIHKHSPFQTEPVDFVRWVPNDSVYKNDYNPNAVAPPEMELLRLSIDADGFTQPIVSYPDDDGRYQVVDGFHRHRVGKEYKAVRERVHGYLPLVAIRSEQSGKADRMASTVRHNRARGKHSVDAMSDMVIELKRRNWSDAKIAKNLGMDADEVLRLCQLSGLSDLFNDSDFSQAWDAEGAGDAQDFEALTDQFDTGTVKVRTANTSDEKRIFHPYKVWECYRAGFYATGVPGASQAECEERYRAFLADDDAFRKALEGVISEWKYSCEHYLTNSAMNRIAWLGQASAAYAEGLPSMYRGGFNLLTPEQQAKANATALEYLNKWLVANGRDAVNMEEADPDRQADIY